MIQSIKLQENCTAALYLMYMVITNPCRCTWAFSAFLYSEMPPATAPKFWFMNGNFVSVLSASGLWRAFLFGSLGFIRVIETGNKHFALLFLLLNLGGVVVLIRYCLINLLLCCF